MKTLEFKLQPTLAQAQTIDLWLEQLKWVWNRGLSLLEEDQQRRWREKHQHSLPDSLKLKWKDGKFVSSGVYKSKNGYKCCDIRTNRNIEDPKNLFVSGSYYNNEHIPEFLKDLPSKFRTGAHKSLQQAWKNYQDPKHPARRPQYKRKKDKLKSLTNHNAGGKSKELKPERVGGGDNAYVNFPKLGKLYVKGFFKRFNFSEYGLARIVKEPSGYYLQVCVDIPNVPLKESDKSVGIDPGLISVVTTDRGREVPAPKLYRKQQQKLKRLQRKASRQKRGSNSQKRTYDLIAKHHEKIRRSRNAFNHKLSTKVVREYGAIVIEDIPLQNLNRRPKPKKREDGKGYVHTGARRKAGLNKSFADSALGDLIKKIETKAKAVDREFVKVAPHYTTIDCSSCGAQVKKALSTRTHRCTECGFIDTRDGNAGKNILLKGRESLEKMYRSWEWELKREETVNSPSSGTTSDSETLSDMGMPPEAAQAAPEHEYCSQSLRGRGDVNFPSALPDNSNSGSTISSGNSTTPSIRDSCTASNSGILPKPLGKQKRKKRTSAQADTESFIQLTLWDIGVETELGDTG